MAVSSHTPEGGRDGVGIGEPPGRLPGTALPEAGRRQGGIDLSAVLSTIERGIPQPLWSLSHRCIWRSTAVPGRTAEEEKVHLRGYPVAARTFHWVFLS